MARRFSARRSSNRRDSRVFIIGAGVSASCGLPVAQTLLTETMDRLAQEDANSERRIHKLLEYLYPSFSGSLRNYPNIEDFLNLIEMAREFNTEEYIKSNLWPQPEVDRVRRSVLKAVTDYMWDRMKACDLSPLQKFADSCLQAGDTIVTFNWDLTIEQTLETHSSLEFWYALPSHILLLKPHGSVNWFLRSRIPKGEVETVVRKIDDDLWAYPEFSFAKYREMKKPEPVIVPPVFHKKFSRVPFLKEVWRRVYRAVSKTSELYIMGYSLPKEDQFARLVLGRALRNNKLHAQRGEKKGLRVTVVNPDEGAPTTFMRLLGQGGGVEFQFYHSTFRRFAALTSDGSIDLP